MRGVAALLCAILLVAPALAFTETHQDSRGPYVIEDPHWYPIIFIPGVAGTELYYDGDQVWPGWLYQRWTGGDYDKLAFDERGRSKYGITPLQSIRSGIEADLGGYGRVALGPDFMFGIYGPFFDYMEAENYTLEQDPGNGLRLYDFAYDWRVDNHANADRLEAFIEDALKETKSDKVILFAHSMGGVIARLYLAEPARAEKVAGVVFMGTPHQGSPKPFYAYTYGYNFGNKKITDEQMWSIMGNWQAGYQLLPAYSYIQDEETGAFWPVEDIYGDGWISWQEYAHYLQAEEEASSWTIRYGLPNRKYAQQVVAFQQELGDALPQYPWIKYYMIEGVDQETTQYFTARLEDVGLPKPVLYLKEVKTKQGDGTVPARGAKVEGLTSPAREVFTDHGSIPGWPGSHPLLTGFREDINHEPERLHNAGLLYDYTERELQRVREWPSSGSVFKALAAGATGIFKPDAEKIKAREELRGSVKEMLAWAHITVEVAPGTPDADVYYLVIEDYLVTEAGPGRIRPGTARVVVDSWDTFDGLMDNSIPLRAAYEDGRVQLKGISVVKRFQFLVMKWFAKWA